MRKPPMLCVSAKSGRVTPATLPLPLPLQGLNFDRQQAKRTFEFESQSKQEIGDGAGGIVFCECQGNKTILVESILQMHENWCLFSCTSN